ncbi:MAG: ABC transporter ATP-binding protein [Rhodospirillales bacterium]|nr:ABC transporter ATP-binding protein [Rhodospirillales bacterium]MDP6772703.1 ABC transporter ATP-binding protein [Rhodospirillales bacterium]
MSPLLQVCDLTTHLFTVEGVVKAVEGLSFDLDADETLALVGESGCGKSMTALSLMGLVPDPPGRIVGGQVLLGDRDLLQLSEHEMQKIRGNEIAMVFQEPMTSLNPVFTVGDQIVESVLTHRQVSRRQARERAVELLDLVRIPDPRGRFDDYPHRLSGGMRQRVMIAMALACDPDVLIADEPTTALDVTIQAQVLDLLGELQGEFGMGVILITHDLGVVAGIADRVVVMYAGRKVEEAPVDDIFASPLHPYTQGLLGSMPRPGLEERLREIPGVIPSLIDMTPGCSFAPRCAKAMARCREEQPDHATIGDARVVACFAAEEEVAGRGLAVDT